MYPASIDGLQKNVLSGSSRFILRRRCELWNLSGQITQALVKTFELGGGRRSKCGTVGITYLFNVQEKLFDAGAGL